MMRWTRPRLPAGAATAILCVLCLTCAACVAAGGSPREAPTGAGSAPAGITVPASDAPTAPNPHGPPALPVHPAPPVPSPADGTAASPSAAADAATGVPAPSAAIGGPTLTPERAAELVLASDPRFAHAGPRSARLVGQHDWYEVSGTEPPYRVVVAIGWGDCPSGCIEHHTWTFRVSATGAVTLLGEAGDPLE